MPAFSCCRRKCPMVLLVMGLAVCLPGTTVITQSARASEVVKVWEVQYPETTIFAGLSPDGRRVWRGDVRARRVALLNAADNKEFPAIDVSATTATFSSDSSRMWLLDHLRQQFVVADANGVVLHKLDYPPGVALSEMSQIGIWSRRTNGDGKQFYVALPSGRVLRIEQQGIGVEAVFDWHDYRKAFNFRAQEESNAIVRLDFVTPQKLVGRINHRLFVFRFDDDGGPRMTVEQGEYYPLFSQMDVDNHRLFFTTSGADSQIFTRVATFDLKQETMTLGPDLQRRLARLMFVSPKRNRLVEVPPAGENGPATMTISDLDSGRVIETLRCATTEVSMLSADSSGNSWITVDSAGTVSLWKWRD